MLRKICFLLLLSAAFTGFGAFAQDRPKVGLVLGGGGAKGFAHIAVLEILEEMQIPVDLVVGVSSGAIIGGLYAAGYSPAMIKEAILDLDWPAFFLQDTPVSSFVNELGTGDYIYSYSVEKGELQKGFSSGQMAYTMLKTLTSKIPSYIDFDTLPIPFRAGVVEVPEGRVVLMGQGDLAEAVRASLSLPGVFDPFEIDGKLYIDGGTVENLPIRQARELGCDIIIASDLWPQPDTINTSPLRVPGLILNLYWSSGNTAQHKEADVVLKIDLQDYSLMDFHKSQDIYSVGRHEQGRFREELEKVKEILDSANVASSTRASLTRVSSAGSYREMPFLEPAFLNITGALDRDRAYIEKHFYRLINGKLLEPENLEDFIMRIYETGNYRFVGLRIDSRREDTGIELLLHPENLERIVLLFGGNYQGTFSRDSINKISMRAGVQIQGINGPGSVLSLDASWIDTLSFRIHHLQPMTPEIFITGNAEVLMDKYIIISGFSLIDAEERRLSLVSGELKGGVLIDRHSVFKAGALFFAANSQEPIDDQDAWNSALGFGVSHSYSTLDHLFFPTAGTYIGLDNRLYFPVSVREPWFFDIISLDLQRIQPLNMGFSVATGAFVGFDLGNRLSRLDGLPAGFTAFDRQYFPNDTNAEMYYSCKAAAFLALQFHPWKNLSILGGQLLFSTSFSAGELVNEFEEFKLENMIWAASFNTGLRLKNNFGLQLRIGAGRKGSDPPAPFLAFDLGQVIRSGIKPRQ